MYIFEWLKLYNRNYIIVFNEYGGDNDARSEDNNPFFCLRYIPHAPNCRALSIFSSLSSNNTIDSNFNPNFTPNNNKWCSLNGNGG